MCLCSRNSIRNADPKTRRIWACGQFCLLTSLLMAPFASSFEQRHHDLFDALRGFFVGMAVILMGWSAA